ncbi:MAG TPA: malto-oligosyltrehalose trehalohydrolase [Elusimicrobiota bacterium]|nr:malto-oligosyltrehalose trehalohydrolase [Elusimicrobiota bacterium]
MDHLLPQEARASGTRVLSGLLGARPGPEGVFFRVWAPRARSVAVELERGARPPASSPLRRTQDGCFEGLVAGAAAGDEYRYRVDGAGPFPDPASRFQPRGVHGPSLVVDPGSFRWTDGGWKGVPPGELVFYELHVGAFTPEGTFDGVAARLGELSDLGATAIELMPVGDFPGSRNWGYDGTAIFAPARAYGDPDSFRRLVDSAHARGLAVFLDVVYNHLGPDGNYTGAFSPFYFTDRHRSPWGDGVNLDGEECRHVREFFIENAVRWIREYHLDGLRLDATHALVDDSRRHFLRELRERVSAEALAGRRALLVAEDDRNLDLLIRKPPRGGFGLDAVWADDFHHQVRRLLAGDRDGYYRDFEDRVEDLTTILRQGWLYTGQHSAHLGRARGTSPDGLAPERFVFCLQNHDQIGNRAHGERLNACIDAAPFLAATVLLLTAPQTPLLFMGQEWGAETPFLYFTDHEPELGRKVTEGRRREFAAFERFSDPAARESIPDPQAAETFERSRLQWEERVGICAQGRLKLHRDLLRLRRAEFSRAGGFAVMTLPNRDGVALHRRGAARPYLILVQLRRAGRVDLSDLALPRPEARWRVLLSTEEAAYSCDPHPPACRLDGPQASVQFYRPGAVILEEI